MLRHGESEVGVGGSLLEDREPGFKVETRDRRKEAERKEKFPTHVKLISAATLATFSRVFLPRFLCVFCCDFYFRKKGKHLSLVFTAAVRRSPFQSLF
jgi:hypothetical protein